MRRVLTVPAALAASAVTAVVCAVPAAAAPHTDDASSLQAPPALSWITLTDSKGISIWSYELSLDRGGLTNPAKFFWSSIAETAWGAYRALCALALWFLDWVLGFGWVNVVAAPLMAVGDAIRDVVSRLGLVPTLLTVTAFAAGGWLLRGRRMTAFWEVGVACLIATLASGVLANPVALVAGPDGYVVRANQVGQELASALATGDAAGKTPEQLRADQTQALVDTFLRQPTQMINFGAVLDGGTCEAAFDDVVRAGPYNDGSNVRDAVGDCDQRLGEFAASPNASMALGSLLFLPAGLVVLGLAVVVAGSVVVAGCWAMYQSLKAVVVLVTGILPGGMRGSLMLTVAETTMSLLILVFTSVFLGVFLLVIQSVFANSADQGLARTFVITDVLLVVGLVIYLRAKGRIRKASARLAQLLSRRPGGAPPTALPGAAAMPGKAGAMARAAASGFVGAQLRGRGGSPGPQPGVKGVAAAAVKTATTAAAAAASGGTSTAVTTAVRAGRTVSSSRRAVVLTRMAANHARDRQGVAPPPPKRGFAGRLRRRKAEPSVPADNRTPSPKGGTRPGESAGGAGRRKGEPVPRAVPPPRSRSGKRSAGDGVSPASVRDSAGRRSGVGRWGLPISGRAAGGNSPAARASEPKPDGAGRGRVDRRVFPLGRRTAGEDQTGLADGGGQSRRRVSLQARLAGVAGRAGSADHQPAQDGEPRVRTGRRPVPAPEPAATGSQGRGARPAAAARTAARQPVPEPSGPDGPKPARPARPPAAGASGPEPAKARPRATGPRRRVARPGAGGKRPAVPVSRSRSTADV